MLRIDSVGLGERLASAVQRQASSAEGKQPDEQQVRAGLRVSLSELGQARASAKNEDIDEAELPDNIKEILKLIRALRQQIAEKQAALQALLAQTGMDADARQMHADALHSELISLQAALSGAQASLVNALRDKRLSDDQCLQAASLATG